MRYEHRKNLPVHEDSYIMEFIVRKVVHLVKLHKGMEHLVHEGHLLARLKHGLVEHDLKGRSIKPDRAEQPGLERGFENIREEGRGVYLSHLTSLRRASSRAAAACARRDSARAASPPVSIPLEAS